MWTLRLELGMIPPLNGPMDLGAWGNPGQALCSVEEISGNEDLKEI
jgi:hypothetical protein